MRILIEGAQGTGKTSLIEALKTACPELEMVEALRPKDFDTGNLEFDQVDLINAYLRQVREKSDGVWDRGFLSGLAITKWLMSEKGLHSSVLSYYENQVFDKEFYNLYDWIFILEPLDLNSVPDDNRRDTRVEVRDEIQNSIMNYMKKIDKKFKGLYEILPGTLSVESRVNLIKGLLKL